MKKTQTMDRSHKAPVDAQRQTSFANTARPVTRGEPPYCTQMIPWRTHADDGTTPCPYQYDTHDEKMHGKAGPCINPDCPGRRPILPHAYNYHENATSSLGGQNEELPSEVRRRESTRIICDPHKTDALEFWQVEKLYEAHLVGTYEHHRAKLMEQYLNGRNTCTCRYLLRKRYCRRLSERSQDFRSIFATALSQAPLEAPTRA